MSAAKDGIIAGASVGTWIERWRAAAHAHDRRHLLYLGNLLWIYKDAGPALAEVLAEVLAYAHSVMTPRLADEVLEAQVWHMMRRASTDVTLEVQLPDSSISERPVQHFTLDRWVKAPPQRTAQTIRVSGTTWTGEAIDTVWSELGVSKVHELWEHPDWPRSSPALWEAEDMLPRNLETPGRTIHLTGEAIAYSVRGDWETRNMYSAEFRRWAIEERVRCWLKVRLGMRPHQRFVDQVRAVEERNAALGRTFGRELIAYGALQPSRADEVVRLTHAQPPSSFGGGAASRIITKMF